MAHSVTLSLPIHSLSIRSYPIAWLELTWTERSSPKTLRHREASIMKRLIKVAPAVVLLLGLGKAALAAPIPAFTIERDSSYELVAAEKSSKVESTKVKQYVTTSKPKAVTAPSGFTVSTGAVLPQTIELEAFPADVGVTQYRYVQIGGQTVLVEPSSRRIIEVIQ